MTVEAEVVAGRYHLVREVGRGGMGAVWLAHDELLGRDVALKRLGQVHGVQSQARAQREAQLAARLSHPNVVTVFDLAEDGETRWLVMEYVEGTTLSKLAADRGGLPPDEAAAIIRQAAEALSVAHASGIVHRDVKPSNLIVAADGTTKLADFGIARGDSDDTLTATGIITGSPAYLSPEVATGGVATPASDVWSLGGALYQALTGRPPYESGDNVVAGLVRIVHDDPPRLPDGSGRLGTVLAATMVKDPEQRWTAAQVCAYLDTTDGDGTRPLPRVTAPPPPPAAPATLPPPQPAPPRSPAPPARPARPARPRRRPPLLWPVAGAVLLVVLVLGAWLVSRTGPDGGGDEAAAPTSSATAGSPSAGPSSTAPSAASGPSADGMAGFVTDYLDTVTRDPRTAFTMLTPSFQEASGGFAGYRAWWAPVHGASVSDVQADPKTMTVSYHVVYDGPASRPSSDDVTLRLVYQDGRYLIDGEPE